MKTKLLLFRTLAVVACMACAIGASAYSFSSVYNGKTIYYNITNSSAKTVEVTYKDSNKNSYSGAITIPETVTYNGTTYTVTAIGEDAFYGSESMTSISMPNTVASLGWQSFYNCSGLKSVTIPNAVTTIGWLTFTNCSGLTSVTLPSSLVSFGECAFMNCSSLTSITIPNSVTSIGYQAFTNCTSLTQVTFGRSVKTIGANAFKNTSLTNLVLPGLITSIDNNAFQGVYNIQSVTCLATTPPSLGNNVFDPDNYATAILIVPCEFGYYYEYDDKWSAFNYVNLDPETGEMLLYDFSSNGIYYNITENYTACVVSLGYENGGCYSGNVGIPKTVNYKNTNYSYTVTGIGGWAFYNCTGLTNVTMPNTITEIGDWAFVNCSALTTMTIPASVTYVGAVAFEGCNLTSVTCLPTTPPEMCGDDPFYYSGVYANNAPIFVPKASMSTYNNEYYWNNFNIQPTLNNAANVSGGNIQFNSTGTYPWTNVVEGSRTYVRSGNMAVHSSVSEMSANVTVPSGYKSTRLYFDYKAWGEGTSPVYDKCIFYVDGVEQFRMGAEKNNWIRYNVELTPGTHTIVWSYQKDGSVHPTGDYFAVDNVNLYCENYENRLWTESINTPAGSTINIPVYLENSELVNRLQFDFKLPNYSNYLVDVIKGERLNEDAQVQFNANNGRVIIHDMMNTDVIINEAGQGVLCYLKVKVPANMGGENPMDFTNMLLVEPSGNVYLDDWESWLCINGSIGDANNDGQVNIADVTTLIDYLLGVDVPQFDPINANVNQDDQINIADVTALIDQLLGL